MNGNLYAINAANRALNTLSIDQSLPVDVYDALDRAGVFLTFGELHGVLGVSLPQLGGVMITTRRPSPVQRYTAAHELAHCVLHQRESMILDDEDKILGASVLEQEAQAQIFASAFLMPPDLAYATADQHDIQPGRSTSVAVGRAARDMGVSFEATARRFVDLDRLAPGDIEGLLSGRSRWRRQELFDIQPTRGAQDVWGVRASTEPAELAVTAGDQVTIQFPENRTTGFRWTRLQDTNTQGPEVMTVGDVFRLPAADHADVIVGQQGERLISLMPSEPGSATMKWQLLRPFDPDTVLALFEAHLAIQPPPRERRRRQILATPLDSPSPPADLVGGNG